MNRLSLMQQLSFHTVLLATLCQVWSELRAQQRNL